MSADDVSGATEVIHRYGDLGLGLADGLPLVVLADRYGTLDLLTLDERHFRAVSRARGTTVSDPAGRRFWGRESGWRRVQRLLHHFR